MNWNEFGQGLTAIVGGIITVAIVSVIVRKGSSSVALVQAAGNTLSGVIGAAVNPAATAATNGNPSAATFTTSAIGSQFNPALANINWG